MRQVEAHEGDIFCTAGGGMGVVIREYTDQLDPDGQSEFSHAGVLVSREGKTFEARAWGVKHYNMTDHVGERVLLGRHVAMDAQKFQAGYREIQRDDGKMYPFHRLALHLCPPLARWIATGRMLVCSEEAVKFLVNSVGFPTKYKSGKGIAPWYLADAIRRWDDYEVVDDGVYGIEWIIQQPEPGSGSGTQAPGDMPTAGAPGGGDLVPGHVPTGGDHDPPAGDLPTLP